MRLGSVVGASTRHVLGAGFEAFLIVATLAALVFAATAAGVAPGGARPALAAKSTTVASISLAGVTGLAAAVQPSLGDTVTFNVSVPKNVNNPRVELKCYQSGAVVYGETGSVAQATGDGTDPLGYEGFLLGGGGSIWLSVGGSAECTANLFYFGQHAGVQTFNVIAATDFSAGG